MKRIAAVAALLLSTTSVACAAPDIKLSGSSDGEKGRLSFALHSGSCAFVGCGLDEPVLAGSKMGVQVGKIDPNNYVVRASGGAVVSDKNRSCDSGGECVLDFMVTSVTPGDVRIEIVDLDGTLADAATVHFVAADRVESRLSADGKELVAAADGAYTIGAGRSFSIASKVFAEERELVVGEGGFQIAYTNASVVVPGANDLFVGTSVEPATAKAPGDGSVRIATAGGVSREIRVHVTP